MKTKVYFVHRQLANTIRPIQRGLGINFKIQATDKTIEEINLSKSKF